MNPILDLEKMITKNVKRKANTPYYREHHTPNSNISLYCTGYHGNEFSFFRLLDFLFH